MTTLPVDHLLGRYGYLTVAVLVAAEGVGLPLPGETALIAGAALSARGHLALPWVIATSILGVVVGGCGGYWIGRTGGYALVVRYGRWVGIKEQELEYTSAFFKRHGAAAVVIGRFLPIIRILTGLTAGIAHMDFARFMVANAVAGVVWSGAFGILGYEFSRNMFRFERQYGWVVVAGVVVVGAVAFLAFKRHEAGARRAL